MSLLVTELSSDILSIRRTGIFLRVSAANRMIRTTNEDVSSQLYDRAEFLARYAQTRD